MDFKEYGSEDTPMRDIHIAAAQFEARDADQDYNFGRIEALLERAARLAPCSEVDASQAGPKRAARWACG